MNVTLVETVATHAVAAAVCSAVAVRKADAAVAARESLVAASVRAVQGTAAKRVAAAKAAAVDPWGSTRTPITRYVVRAISL